MGAAESLMTGRTLDYGQSENSRARQAVAWCDSPSQAWCCLAFGRYSRHDVCNSVEVHDFHGLSYDNVRLRYHSALCRGCTGGWATGYTDTARFWCGAAI